MKKNFTHVFGAVCAFVLLSSSVASAFNPYLGNHVSLYSSRDYLVEETDGSPSILSGVIKDSEGTANITNTGGPFDAKLTIQGSSGKKRKTIVIQLNGDGTGTCTINGRVSTRRAKSTILGGVSAGSTVLIESGTSGTWTLGDGVRTTFDFQGKTNRVPTKITGSMDLVDGKFVLNLKMKYKKGNSLFAKPTVIQFGL